ncbi:MAG: nucleoside hydrolase [Propionibacteriaceae bacterium]
MTDTRFIVDCDTGVDDAMALLYLLSKPEIEILGISTVFGNISAGVAAQATLRVLELAGATHIPVAQGTDTTIRGDVPELAPHVHGHDGLGNTGLPAPETTISDETGPELIVRLARENPGQLHLIATGPLSNVALALGLEPNLTELLPRITIMGGAADAPGNQTPAAEANILHDPEAAQAVFSANWDITLVPLDVTMKEIVTEGHRDALRAAGNPVAEFVADITDHYFNYFHGESFSERRSPCHDALAAAIAAGTVTPQLAPIIDVQVDCNDGPARGATICDTRGMYQGFPLQEGAHCRVILRTDGTFPDEMMARFAHWGSSTLQGDPA